MSAFAADDAKAAVDLRFVLLDGYGAHGAVLGAAAATYAAITPYLHRAGGGDKAS